MSKFPIAWHRRCQMARMNSLVERQHLAHDLRREIERLQADITFTDRQIAEAEKRGLTEFDSEKFLRPRKPSTTKPQL